MMTAQDYQAQRVSPPSEENHDGDDLYGSEGWACNSCGGTFKFPATYGDTDYTEDVCPFCNSLDIVDLVLEPQLQLPSEENDDLYLQMFPMAS